MILPTDVTVSQETMVSEPKVVKCSQWREEQFTVTHCNPTFYSPANIMKVRKVTQIEISYSGFINSRLISAVKPSQELTKLLDTENSKLFSEVQHRK